MKLLYSVLGLIIISLAVVVWMNSGDKAASLPSTANHPQKQAGDDLSQARQPSLADHAAAQSGSAALKTPPSSDADDLSRMNPDYPTLEMRLDEMQARRNGKTFDPDAVMAALQKSAAWETGGAQVDKLNLNEEELNDGREFVQFDRLKLETLVSGDTLDLPIQQTGQTYKTKITQAQSNPDGSVTWQGTLMDTQSPIDSGDSQNYDVTFTSGNKIVSGGVFTPEGHFVIEAVEDQGWIANAGKLYRPNENEPDVIIPPDNHQH